jgi:excisionase family DNA binding protein
LSPTLEKGRKVAELPRLALTPDEAARALSMSRDSFDRHVRHELRLVRRGRLVLIPVRELERWVERSAALTLDGTR